MATRRCLLLLVTGLAAVATALPAAAWAAPAATHDGVSAMSRHAPAWGAPAHQPAVVRPPPSGLEVSINDVEPSVLTPGRPFSISGVVSNIGRRSWPDAQVYLDVGRYPATSASDLDAFAEPGVPFSIRLIEYGQFAELGRVLAGTQKSFEITVPYADLEVIGTAGVYKLGVSVVAGIGENRDESNPVAVATTLLSLPPADNVEPTPLVCLVPIVAAITQDSRGVFADDSLALEIGSTGRLRGLVDFALQAPADSLQILLDPAVHNAVTDMSDGYEVQSSLESESEAGGGESAAQTWLAELDALMQRQHVLLLPWGAPQASTLAADRLAQVVRTAVASASAYSDRLPYAVAGWQPTGMNNERGLVSLRTGGTAFELLSEASLPGLDEVPLPDGAPSAVSLETADGPLTAIVIRDDVASQPLTATTSPLDVRQFLVAEATVQSLAGRREPVVLSLPADWEPDPGTPAIDLQSSLGLPVLDLVPASSALEPAAPAYAGQVSVADDVPRLEPAHLDAIRRLRAKSRVYLDILVDTSPVETVSQRQFALTGSSAWAVRPGRGRAQVTRETRLLRQTLEQVSVAAPTFVALSSGSGRFPVTVSNGLDVPVRIRVSLRPNNPALQVDALGELRLEPGQQRDLQVNARADGSGLTPVRVQLATPGNRRFGPTSETDVRATQIGVAIWIVVGLGFGVLMLTAIMRVIRRLRSPGAFSPREEPRHP